MPREFMEEKPTFQTKIIWFCVFQLLMELLIVALFTKWRLKTKYYLQWRILGNDLLSYEQFSRYCLQTATLPSLKCKGRPVSIKLWIFLSTWTFKVSFLLWIFTHYLYIRIKRNFLNRMKSILRLCWNVDKSRNTFKYS